RICCVNFWVNFANFYPHKAKIGSNRLGQYRTIQPIKKPLNIDFKVFFYIPMDYFGKNFGGGGGNLTETKIR
ncbi:hypothetical protein, partial [Acinetobacter sp.]|uniref:hypothetical protein n=1 Tax=Acinetobacter sp. TaxID=472 RepID=UPI0035AFA57F